MVLYAWLRFEVMCKFLGTSKALYYLKEVLIKSSENYR